MLSVPVFDMSGKSSGEIEVNPAVFGDRVRPRLIKQSIVAHLNHRAQGSARTKGRSNVEGSTRKLYRQKGTGNARAGSIRTPVRRGGGRTFARRGPRRSLQLPKKMRRLACDSAILAKILANEALIVKDLACSEVKTKTVATMLAALDVRRGCLVATKGLDRNLYLSGRNIPRTDVRPVDELNAYDVLRRQRLVFSKGAFERLIESRAMPAKAAGGKASKGSK